MPWIVPPEDLRLVFPCVVRVRRPQPMATLRAKSQQNAEHLFGGLAGALFQFYMGTFNQFPFQGPSRAELLRSHRNEVTTPPGLRYGITWLLSS